MVVVSIVKTNGNVEAGVKKAVELAGDIDIDSGETVLIKPNLSCAKPSGSGIVTSVEVISAMVKLVKDIGGKPIVGDLPIAGWDPQETYKITGVKKAVEKAGGQFVDFSKDETVTIQIPDAVKLRSVKLVRTALTADAIISLPVFKAHFFTGLTLCIKNLKGLTLQDQRTKMHVLGLYDPIIDLFSAIKNKVVFGLIDGTVGCESIRPSGPYYGPTEGKPIKLDTVIAGKDIVAVDSVAAVTAGIKPKSMKLLKIAYERGLGEIEDIEVRGERVKPLKLKQTLFGRIMGGLNSLWTSKIANPVTHPLVKRLFGPQVQSLRSVEKELEEVVPSKIVLVGECDSCGICVESCGIGNIKLGKKGPIIGEKCLVCLICVEACPKSALAVKRVEEVSA
ncbi:MAG: DUF362 domain-containing protein [Candidatus Jordarchaeum sp.]|uniref:DUF362 domain-containing protein n=1 Tax=Candidatus Jordarchaeum sp. TaxID=2823881 RepID=UPI004049AF1A